MPAYSNPPSPRTSIPRPPRSGPVVITPTGVPTEDSWFERWVSDIRRRKSDIYFMKYGCPAGGKYHTVTVDGCDEYLLVGSTAGGITFKPGATVVVANYQGGRDKVIIGLPPPGQTGTTAASRLVTARTQASIGIISADPSVLDSGSTGNSVDVYGFGFTSATTWSAVVWNPSTSSWDADPYVTITAEVYVDSENFTLTIDVSASAPAGYTISLSASK